MGEARRVNSRLVTQVRPEAWGSTPEEIEARLQSGRGSKPVLVQLFGSFGGRSKMSFEPGDSGFRLKRPLGRPRWRWDAV